jgi:tetratricopeptide (TPR) repeat protein
MLVDEVKYSWYQVPDDVKGLLKLAADKWDNTAEAEKYINEALAKSPDNIDVLVTAYRFFFYKNKFSQVLEVADKVTNIVKDIENFPDNWEQLKPILIERQNDPQIRLYLNAYAASGFVLARLGQLEKAKEVAARVKEVDVKKEFGASTIFEILTSPPDDEDED